ncbi:hypothetical protein ACXR0O_23325 [Verrucomicrobiota bacterium sgz303538]
MHRPDACRNDEPLIRPEALRERLNIGIAGYEALLRQGLPFFKLNDRVYRFRWSDVERWLQERRAGKGV